MKAALGRDHSFDEGLLCVDGLPCLGMFVMLSLKMTCQHNVEPMRVWMLPWRDCAKNGWHLPHAVAGREVGREDGRYSFDSA